jgi:hypothetical protein
VTKEHAGDVERLHSALKNFPVPVEDLMDITWARKYA